MTEKWKLFLINYPSQKEENLFLLSYRLYFMIVALKNSKIEISIIYLDVSKD